MSSRILGSTDRPRYASSVIPKGITLAVKGDKKDKMGYLPLLCRALTLSVYGPKHKT